MKKWVFMIILGVCRRPVVLIPGIAGSGLIMNAKNATVPLCDGPQTIEGIRSWFSVTALMPPASHQACWASLMELQWSLKEKVYHDVPNVHVMPADFGTVAGIDFLDYVEGFGVGASAYFADIISAFKEAGYEEGVDLFGSGYDWRYPPWQLHDYFAWLKHTIETSTYINSEKPVVISHSLGALAFQYFLNFKVDEFWKSRFIDSHIAIAPATGGSFKAIRAILSGYDDFSFNFLKLFHIELIPQDILKKMLRTIGSSYALLPNTEVHLFVFFIFLIFLEKIFQL
eukprot:GHVP01026202.1.p1 GENE.GHVP01026202.1~~GHVP01026202.1.p1  ORF type:complete len:285 (+),score=30.62 GHVP01026202.1:443-1297(+)